MQKPGLSPEPIWVGCLFIKKYNSLIMKMLNAGGMGKL